jgi:predicted ATPase/DNA-binding CsgD family transcriptional regulator
VQQFDVGRTEVAAAGIADAVARPGPARALTVLASDFEDAGPLWGTDPEAMERAVGAHAEIVADAAARNGGAPVPRGGGETRFAVFRRPQDALAAALEIRRAVRGGDWPAELDRRVRIALYTADVKPGFDRDDLAPALGRCLRLAAIARGGQLVLSHATYELLVVDGPPHGVELADLGVHGLPDLGRPEHVYGLAGGDAAAGGELRSLDTLPNNLPRGLTSFVGRERELAEIDRLLRGARLLTLTGAGGCGKTRLALQAAADAVARFPGGVWWVDLAPIDDPARVGEALAEAVGAREPPGGSALATVVAHLRPRRALVLLDNCEHVLDGAAGAAQALFGGCPEVTVLATSRAPYGLPTETVWAVPPLSLPDTGAGAGMQALAGSDAVRLFVERAAAVRAGFTIAETTAPALAEICSELDGMPLAIELAAAQVRLMPVEQIAARLRDRFRLLTGGPRTGQPRHRSLRASVDSSHDLLSDEERTLFRRLGVFAGGFTLEACEEVCAFDAAERDRVVHVLGSLVDKSLVMVDEQSPEVRYRLLETMREYALERLRAAEESDAIRDRHRDFFLGLAESIAPELESADAPAVLDVLDTDRGNLGAALGWASETDGERALRLCTALTPWWRMRGIFAAADTYCTRALDAPGAARSPLRARVLCTRAHLLTYAGSYGEATASARDALEVAEELGGEAGMARALDVLGRLLFSADPVAYRPMHERGRDLARASGEDMLLVTTLQNTAWGHMICAEYDEGERLFAEARAVIERRGFCEPLPWNLLGSAYRHMASGSAEQFNELVERALAAARAIGDPVSEALAHAHLAIVELAQGQAEAALARLEASRERVVARGAGMAFVLTELQLAAAEATLGDLASARARLEAVVATEADRGVQLGWAMAQLADVLRVAGDTAASEDWARKALEVNARVRTPHGITWCKEILGRLAAARGDWIEAESLLHQALAPRAQRRMWLWVPQTLDALAEVAAGMGSQEVATRLLGAVERARDDLGLVRWAPDGPRFKALERDLRAQMGDAAFTTAWAEGQGLTLERAVEWIRRSRGSHKRPRGGWEGLTPTEREVARHVAAGLTNGEIGRAMFVAPGTVKTHLSHIYAKLGVRNRAELTAETARRVR